MDPRRIVLDPAVTGVRLTRALLAWHAVAIAIITLVPFRFGVPDGLHIMIRGTLFDGAANILLFVPLGFLYRALRPSPDDRYAARVLLLGALASAGIEITQLFEPHRYSAPLDVLANGSGAWLGALLRDRVTRQFGSDTIVARLSLEIPLVGLAWLVVPLLWLGSLAAEGDGVSVALLALPALLGGHALAWVHRNRAGWSAAGVAGGAAGGTLIGLFPAVATSTTIVLTTVSVVGAYTGWAATRMRGVAGPDRRFEQDALRTGAPFYMAFLLALGWFVVPERGAATDSGAILRVLEGVAAYTVLGYMLAEWRGRVDEDAVARRFGVLARAAPLVILAAAGPLTDGAGSHAGAWIVCMLASSIYGGEVYGLQRDHVRALLEARDFTPAAPLRSPAVSPGPRSAPSPRAAARTGAGADPGRPARTP